MKLVLTVATIAVLFSGCDKLNELADQASNAQRVCIAQSGSGYTCRQFEEGYSQEEIASACQDGTLTSDLACPTSYQNTSSWGSCSYQVDGRTNTYRFYMNNLINEQLQCAALDLITGTSEWNGDIF